MAPTKKIGTEKKSNYEMQGSLTSRSVAEGDPSQGVKQKGYTVDEAAKQLSISSSTLRNWMRQGKIESFKIGTNVRISDDVIRAIVGDCGKQNSGTDLSELDPRNKITEEKVEK